MRRQPAEELRLGRNPRAFRPGRMSTILKIGMRGNAVRGLQQRLKAQGFLKGKIDGIFGLKTQTAVKMAQRKYEQKLRWDCRCSSMDSFTTLIKKLMNCGKLNNVNVELKIKTRCAQIRT
ncbi:MAG: hypothetical protein F6K23_31530 [Okeania sp. SIO2C9]|uniref:peptidoglycan-binding domain-containing protein n=1 Tax=Okeania sp. SIO2C9 TaxID=2607791 RepID=UPI0013C1F71F|nr:peptidoglycan-binding domain-containing protein [Okeania sp. SIO2C9]NEQ77145.1 hypothetical protein [Okeania sp. SIO2C9]